MAFKLNTPDDEATMIFTFVMGISLVFIVLLVIFFCVGCGPVAVEIAEELATEVLEDVIIVESKKFEEPGKTAPAPKKEENTLVAP
jgi:hypothetical protein